LILNELFTGTVPHGTGYRAIGSIDESFAWLDPLVEQMLRQQPEERPDSILSVKNALIAHQQDFIARQRLDELQGMVVPATTVTDPLADRAPAIVDADYGGGKLILTLDTPVNSRWVDALHNMGNYSFVMGKEPE